MNTVFTATADGHYKSSLLYHSRRKEENAGMPTFITEIGKKKQKPPTFSKLHGRNVSGIY
jgi:hypothetical protein